MVNRRALLLTTVTVFVALALGPASAAAAASLTLKAAPPTPILTWTDCGGGFQCATAQVPLDYDQPLGQTISIALIRQPALDPSHRIGSLFINPGGPGGSGVDVVRGFTQFFPQELQARFDIVGFDPRGVGLSTPVQCFASAADQQAFLSSIPQFPVTRAEETAYIKAFAQFDELCAARNRNMLAHMSTANADRDMDLLRQAVGDQRLTYLGVSYGTYLGATYVNLFPNRVRAVVLDGAIEPVEWATGRGSEAARLPFSTRLRSDAGALKTLNAFLALCEQAGPSLCAFAAISQGSDAQGGDLREKFHELMSRMLEQPVVLSTPVGPITITYADAVSFTLGALYEPGVWPLLGAALQELWLASGGGPSGGGGVQSLQRKLALRPGAQPYNNGFDAFAAIACADTDNPRSASAWPRAAHQADERSAYFGSPWTYASMPCAQWQVSDSGRYTGPWNRSTANPILVVGNLFDPATRYESAVSLSHLLANARLLTLDGWGHTAILKSTCIDDAMVRYLVDGQLPPIGTVCKPDMTPFGSPPSVGIAARQQVQIARPPLPRTAG
jgi:pimeloyl-ACP methyl ester carboxylesterase